MTDAGDGWPGVVEAPLNTFRDPHDVAWVEGAADDFVIAIYDRNYYADPTGTTSTRFARVRPAAPSPVEVLGEFTTDARSGTYGNVPVHRLDGGEALYYHHAPRADFSALFLADEDFGGFQRVATRAPADPAWVQGAFSSAFLSTAASLGDEARGITHEVRWR